MLVINGIISVYEKQKIEVQVKEKYIVN